MLESYTLPVSALAAAVTHAGRSDVRSYLNGVLLDFPKGRIVATDGHRMFVGAIPKADEPAVIVDEGQIRDALKAAKKSKYIPDLYINVRPDPNDTEEYTRPRRVELVTIGARFEGAAIDGTFPDYERVIPSYKPEEAAPGAYNARYLLDAQTALAVYGGREPKRAVFPMYQRGPNMGGLMVGRGSLVVIMPTRTDGIEPGELEWYTGPTSVAAEIEAVTPAEELATA